MLALKYESLSCPIHNYDRYDLTSLLEPSALPPALHTVVKKRKSKSHDNTIPLVLSNYEIENIAELFVK